MVGASTRPARRFQLVLIKPSHYDDDGYVIQWMRAFVPSNTLAVLYSLGGDVGTAPGARARHRHRHHGDRRDPHPRQNQAVARPVSAPRRLRPGRHRRRAVESVSPRARYRPPVPRRWRAGDDRRIPCVRLPGDAAGDAGRPEEDARPGHQHVRRRARRPDGPDSAGRRERDAASRSTTTSRTCRRSSRSRPDPSASRI